MLVAAWENEIKLLEDDMDLMRLTDVQGPNWDKATFAQEKIEQLARSCQRLTDNYRKALFQKFKTLQG